MIDEEELKQLQYSSIYLLSLKMQEESGEIPTVSAMAAALQIGLMVAIKEPELAQIMLEELPEIALHFDEINNSIDLIRQILKIKKDMKI